MLRVAVVGAGPAGSAAACHLAMAGCAVALIDRAAFPRDKVCGDWLTPLALAELDRLGLDRAALAAVAPGHTQIRSGTLGAPGGRTNTWTLAAPGACVPRRMLDAAIRARALAAGCEPVERNVRDPAADATLRTFDVVVDARGANVGHPNAVGLRAYWTLPRAALSADARATVTLQTDAVFPCGYGWWFPVAQDEHHVRLNVGVGLLAADSVPGHHVTDFLARFEERPPLRAWRGLATARTRAVGYHVGLATWRNDVAQGRVLRIGDAANLADPLTGDGIGNALRSGALVAAAIAQSRDGLEAGRRWQAAFAHELAPDLRVALVLRRALQTTGAKNAAAALLAVSTPLPGRLHAALFGTAPYASLIPFRAPRRSGPPRDASA